MPIELQSTEEISKRLASPDRALELHREALNNGMPLSRYLEVIDPTPQGERLDAFNRQLRAANIKTRSFPEQGIWSDTGGAFCDTATGRALYPEFFARQWRAVMYAQPTQERANSIFLSSDSIVGSQEKPWVEAGPFWNSQFAPAIPLSEVVGSTQAIRGEDYRSLYMTYDATALRLYRVGESAEIPIAMLATSGRSIRLKKYGRGLRVTYEQMRRTPIDKIAWWVRWQALQAEVDKVVAALDVIINGDGNANTSATSYNLTTLDTLATVGELSLAAWLAFRMKWQTPYQMTTALGQTAPILQLILLNSGSANVPLAGLNLAGIGNTLIPINTTADGIRYGWTDDAPASKYVAFDKRFALEEITEIGSEITETERFITNQTEIMVMTENSAFAVVDPAASKILNLAA
jgi:hypothetical protein